MVTENFLKTARSSETPHLAVGVIMALPPIVPMGFSPMPTHIEPIVSEPAVSVTPVDETLNNGGTENSSSGSTTEDPESGAQQLPLERALKEINAQMQAWSTHLQFSVDKDVNRIVVTVIDAESGDTLRTIPSETLLNVAKMIVNMQGNAVKTAA